MVAELTDSLTVQAAALGYPSTLFGFTPNERAYWFEPGLPWLPTDWAEHGPVMGNGLPGIWAFSSIQGQHMAPRFPKGSIVNLLPVHTRAELEVGKVYVYIYREGFRSGTPGKEMGHIARLAEIHPDWLKMTLDTDTGPTRHIWPLGDNGETWGEGWSLHEVTHYVSYPGEAVGQ